MEVNSDLLTDPSLVRKDPYGKGWLATVHVPTRRHDPQPGSQELGREWMRKQWSGYSRQPALAGGGGRWRAPGRRPAGGDAGSQVEGATAEFFLTA
jgi:hypothetical protein